MAETTIVPHTFHSFYVFDYFEPKMNDGVPEFLYADWPIINRIPMGAKLPNATKVTKFESEKQVRQWILQNNDIKDEDYCKNYFLVTTKDFYKYRQLFHGLIKRINIDHNFESKLDFKSDGPSVQTCCKAEGLTFTAKYECDGCTKENPGSHCCDRAKFTLSSNGRQIGNINLNNEGDCGARTSGPFSMSAEEVKAVSNGGCTLPINLKCAAADCHDGITDIEIKNDKGKVIANVGLSVGESSVAACKIDYEDFSKDSCCCPPSFVKTEEVPGGGLDDNGNPQGGTTKSKCVKATGYECKRSHKKNIKGSVNFDTSKIFTSSDLKPRLGGREHMKRGLKDVEPPKKDPSEEKDAYKNDQLEIDSKKIYKNIWEFDKTEFKDLFTGDKFPKDRTRINDPVFEYLMSTSGEYITLVKAYIEMIAGPKKEKMLKGSKKLSSKNLGKYSLDITEQNISDIISDVITYYSNFKVGSPVFIEKENKYLFFVDLDSNLNLGNISLTWNAGDYPTGQKDEDEDKYIESIYPEYDNDLYRSITLSTEKINFSSEENDENGKLKKIKIPINFVFEGSPKDLEFECFVFEKKETAIKKQNSKDKKESCCKVDGKMNWKFEDFKVQVHGWWQNDFKSGTSFPDKI